MKWNRVEKKHTTHLIVCGFFLYIYNTCIYETFVYFNTNNRELKGECNVSIDEEYNKYNILIIYDMCESFFYIIIY